MESCDRQSLVVPLLGLYGELLRAAHDGVKGGTADVSAVEAFLKEVEKHQDDVFPKKFNRTMWRKNKRIVEEVILFGDLIDRMRARIKNGSMFIPLERGAETDATDISSDFMSMRHGVLHGTNDFITNNEAVNGSGTGSSFLRHGSVMEIESEKQSTSFVRHSEIKDGMDEA